MLRGLVCALAAALIALPVAAERAVEQVRFNDHLGTFPVEVGLCHDGRSTLDTGLFGKVYWAQTGAFGFGAYARATGPPEAGGTLASYVDPKFIQANVALIDDPDRTVDAYAAELSLRPAPAPAARRAAGGRAGRRAVCSCSCPGGPWTSVSRRRRLATTAALVVVATALSVGAAGGLFAAWDCNNPPGTVYTMPGRRPAVVREPRDARDRLAGQAVHRQEHPADQGGGPRLRGRGHAQLHLGAGTAASGPAPPNRRTSGDRRGRHAGQLRRCPRAHGPVRGAGRVARPRRDLAAHHRRRRQLQRHRGRVGYIKAESKVGGDVPVAAVGGDHDSTRTWQQMADDGIELPDLDTVEVDGLGSRAPTTGSTRHSSAAW